MGGTSLNIFFSNSLPFGVAANPPLDVSLKLSGKALPTLRIASMTSSGGITDLIPAKAMSAQSDARETKVPFLFIQGTSTNPATGSHTKPIKDFIVKTAAWAEASGLPPSR
jgi:hypothetical protein